MRNYLLLDATSADLIRLGSADGGWWLPAGLLESSTVAVCAGAGEDITFDVALVARGLTVYTIDPTPRAVAHVAAVLKSLQSETAGLVNGVNYRTYANAGFRDDRFTFIPVGLWSTEAQLKFFAPSDPSHVSHSVVNLQDTQDYFLAECCSLRGLMERHHIPHVNILKLDVEGAEYAVLEQMIDDRIFPECLLVEFDEGRYVDRFERKRFKGIIALLKQHQYSLVRTDQWNFTFVRAA